MSDAQDKPTVSLIGYNGNAFVILSRCFVAGRKAGWDEKTVSAFREKAMAGDYSNLLRVVQQHFDVTGLNEDDE